MDKPMLLPIGPKAWEALQAVAEREIAQRVGLSAPMLPDRSMPPLTPVIYLPRRW